MILFNYKIKLSLSIAIPIIEYFLFVCTLLWSLTIRFKIICTSKLIQSYLLSLFLGDPFKFPRTVWNSCCMLEYLGDSTLNSVSMTLLIGAWLFDTSTSDWIELRLCKRLALSLSATVFYTCKYDTFLWSYCIFCSCSNNLVSYSCASLVFLLLNSILYSLLSALIFLIFALRISLSF